MTRQLSFSKEEQDIRSEFREMMSQAESTEDVKKFFFQTVRELLNRISDKEWDIEFRRDVNLDLDRGEGWTLSDRLLDQNGLRELLDESDLDNILDRLAEKAWNRYRHLDKHPEKTEQKIYPKEPRRF
ncbi:hypothetical protein [Oceanidesulfovibrio marinus]|uniref:Uncharacterized protein n=1 Tax=Oceanidesulfovibrio marinus TaxID=370038 RepID=A0A6P1ZDQ9_9BACT|nr:hypothetical protein [Oceanidesulfovibrio marinus]QJT10784.1 hypothetical protein E8L03_18495 [Oceanidesulfovibrio marinus]TVM31913.1 hypothetical protein DQK91_17060 [Oceanidesulfovibrio marinus]